MVKCLSFMVKYLSFVIIKRSKRFTTNERHCTTNHTPQDDFITGPKSPLHDTNFANLEVLSLLDNILVLFFASFQGKEKMQGDPRRFSQHKNHIIKIGS